MNVEEQEYLSLLRDILDNGNSRSDRTGTGTKSIFGARLKFNLNTIPVLTTKKVFIKGVVEELLFFIRGETNSKKLEEKGVNIWKGNTSKEFLTSRGLSYPEGEMGPMYGYKWRNFNGVDQLSNALELIKHNPDSRRILVTAYDPSKSHLAVLDECHIFFQFYVNNGKLDCQWYQRSVDFFIGCPFNILSYALLTCLMAKASNLLPGNLIFIGGDVHIYNNHIEQAKSQLLREPFPFPTLSIKDINSIKDMENLSLEDFKFDNYKYHPAIKAPMAI